MSEAPLFNIGDIVYLRESAALGYLEAVRISGITKTRVGWIYTVSARTPGPIAVAHHGDRINSVAGSVLYFTESEFVLVCDALDLAEANVKRQLDKIQAQKASLCVEPTSGT